MAEFEEPPAPSQVQDNNPQHKRKEEFYIGAHTRKKYLKEIGANEDMISVFSRQKQRKQLQIQIHHLSAFMAGKIANAFFQSTAFSLTRSYPKTFGNLSKAIRSSDIRVLSKTYMS